MRRALVLAVVLASAGCSDDESDCVDKCEDAQSRDCTSIVGDCGDFCASLFAVEEPSGCDDERVDYQECLDDQGICSADCDSSENDLGSCVGAYCLAHGGDADCEVLLRSF